ncbi:MAG TPA: phenylacetic acid degradation operon negative regulatory protein PaaX, partial [Accumulibacter sp.]|nr:phenylacetic acid degradation operon negative regulatory protein PaaX [Accumulibacter sp.]
MSVAIHTRIDEFRRQRRVHAGSLIVSLFGDVVLPRGGRVWLGSLIHLLGPLGINERSVRTAVFRLTKDEWLCSEALGRRSEYRLTTSGERRCADAARQIYAARAPHWDRRWRQILV